MFTGSNSLLRRHTVNHSLCCIEFSHSAALLSYFTICKSRCSVEFNPPSPSIYVYISAALSRVLNELCGRAVRLSWPALFQSFLKGSTVWCSAPLLQPVGIYPKKYEWAGSQDSGDCSLWVRAATLEFDDGEWECQVTASDFTTQDALTSSPVRLVVRGKWCSVWRTRFVSACGLKFCVRFTFIDAFVHVCRRSAD